MIKLHSSSYNTAIIFTDEGVIAYYLVEGKGKKRFFPYGCIQSVEIEKSLFGSYFKVVAKDRDQCGNPYMVVLPIYKFDISELNKSIAFAKEKMATAPEDTMFNSSAKGLPEDEEKKLVYQASTLFSKNCERNRIKYRNKGLLILLASILSFIIGCAGPGGFFGVLAIAGLFFGIVGFFMFFTHINTPYTPTNSKSKGNGSIVKGAIIGGIIAGEAGAVVGATIAKNNLDKSK